MAPTNLIGARATEQKSLPRLSLGTRLRKSGQVLLHQESDNWFSGVRDPARSADMHHAVVALQYI